jgi:hypothetical protein
MNYKCGQGRSNVLSWETEDSRAISVKDEEIVKSLLFPMKGQIN